MIAARLCTRTVSYGVWLLARISRLAMYYLYVILFYRCLNMLWFQHFSLWSGVVRQLQYYVCCYSYSCKLVCDRSYLHYNHSSPSWFQPTFPFVRSSFRAPLLSLCSMLFGVKGSAVTASMYAIIWNDVRDANVPGIVAANARLQHGRLITKLNVPIDRKL